MKLMPRLFLSIVVFGCFCAPSINVLAQNQKPTASNEDALVSDLSTSLKNKDYAKALDILEQLQASINKKMSSNTSVRPQSLSLEKAKIALVANKDKVGATGFLQLLKQRDLKPTIFDSMPEKSALEKFDLLIVFPVNTVTTADAKTVEDWLKRGRGVVLVEAAPVYLASEDTNCITPNSGDDGDRNHNLKSISSWFGGVDAIHWVGLELRAKKSRGSFILPAIVAPGEKIAEAKDNFFVILSHDIHNPTVQQVIAGDGDYSGPFSAAGAIAYENQEGGRVYWQYRPYSTPQTEQDKVFGIFLAGMAWASHIKKHQ